MNHRAFFLLPYCVFLVFYTAYCLNNNLSNLMPGKIFPHEDDISPGLRVIYWAFHSPRRYQGMWLILESHLIPALPMQRSSSAHEQIKPLLPCSSSSLVWSRSIKESFRNFMQSISPKHKNTGNVSYMVETTYLWLKNKFFHENGKQQLRVKTTHCVW